MRASREADAGHNPIVPSAFAEEANDSFLESLAPGPVVSRKQLAQRLRKGRSRAEGHALAFLPLLNNEHSVYGKLRKRYRAAQFRGQFAPPTFPDTEQNRSEHEFFFFQVWEGELE